MTMSDEDVVLPFTGSVAFSQVSAEENDKVCVGYHDALCVQH